jgi:YfiH family protein
MDDAIVATDNLVTSSDRITLVILVADCVPVALLDPKARVLAVVHAGWRGTAAGAVGQAVDALCQLGAQPERMMAFLGPAVAPTSYQVTSEVTQALARAVAPADLHADVAQSDGTDHWHVDLTAANRQQLTLAGIDPAQMFESGSTTADGDYFSDRASRPCGRFGLMAQLLAT